METTISVIFHLSSWTLRSGGLQLKRSSKSAAWRPELSLFLDNPWNLLASQTQYLYISIVIRHNKPGHAFCIHPGWNALSSGRYTSNRLRTRSKSCFGTLGGCSKTVSFLIKRMRCCDISKTAATPPLKYIRCLPLRRRYFTVPDRK